MTVTPNSDPAPWGAPPAGQPPLEPVRPPANRRLRWLVAGLASLLVVGALALVFVLANPTAPAGAVSPLARFAPADSAGYIEARLDLPGDQRDRLISFLGHFPGFADPASFDRKINDTIDQLLRGRDFSWSQDIEPWFGGQVVAFSADVQQSEGRPQAGTVVLSVKDRAALDAFLEKARTSAEVGSSEYRGSTIWVVPLGGTRTHLVATGDALLLSARIEDVHAALDVAAGERPGLSADERFERAMARLGGDRLLAVYVDGEAVVDSLDSIDTPVPPLGLGGSLQQAPDAMVGQLRAEADHLLLEMHLLPRAGQTFPNVPQSRSTTLAAAFPADVVGYAEVRDLGQGLKQVVTEFLETFRGVNGEPFPPPDLEQLLGTAPEDFFDFLGDTAISFQLDGERYGGGLVASLTDQDVAQQRLVQLVASLRMMVAFGGADVPLTIDEVQHAGRTVTVLTVRDAGPGGRPLSLSFAITDGRLLLGLGDFVTDALDRGGSGGLGADSRYRAAITAAGETNRGVFYLDLARVRALVEQHAGGRQRGELDEYRPYLEPFGQVVGTVAGDGNGLVTRLLFFVE